MKTEHNSEENNLEFSISFFGKLWDKHSTVITLHQLYQETISNRWQPLTECYRRLKDQPHRLNEAKNVKATLPAVIIEGVCRPNSSHASANLEKLNGLAMYDLDHSAQRTEEIKNLFRHLPYVAYAQTSISGEGLKVVIRLDARTPQEYAVAYAICMQQLERLTAHPCDPQCARITQPCSCVWDPCVYYNPAPEIYPWREELTADPALAQLSSILPDGSPAWKGHYTYVPGNGKTSPIPPATEACGYIEAFVRNFTHYHPWQKGNRHQTMLQLGNSARRKGFSIQELEELINIMSVRIVGDGYTAKELTKDLSSGYQYVDLSYTPKNKESLPTLLTTDTYPLSLPPSPEEEEEETSIKDEEQRASAPCIPDEVYTSLPAFIQEALKPARNNRERDILLLGILANLSACLPQVSTSYDQRPHSPHLYLLVLAPPAAGKGLLSLAGMLPVAINNYLKSENKRKKEEYERLLASWEQTTHQSRKTPPSSGKSVQPMPEEPPYFYLCGAPGTSKSQLIVRLKTNDELGLIINATELDMLTGAIKQDCGKYDDILRAAFHHEPVASDYKVDKHPVSVEYPRLALCLSGTPNQLPAFIRSSENGMFGRFTVYTCEARWIFRSAAPIAGQEDYRSLYKQLSRQVLDDYLFLKQSPTEVILTDEQWAEHTEYFGCLLTEVASEQADAPGSIVLRAALMVVRIASILTALRKCEGTMQMKEYRCTDDDFHAAMQIIKTTVIHSLLVCSSLPGHEVKAKPLKTYFRMRPVMNALPKTFSYNEAISKAKEKGINERSACRYLKKLTELEFIEKQDNKYVKRKKLSAK